MEAAARPVTVLIVEDEPALRRVARLVLERGGYRVLLAEKGAEAMGRLELGQVIDLVICDLNLPDVHGLELYKRLRAGGYYGRFMISSGSFPLASGEGSVPADAMFLPKPWSVDDLERAVREALAAPPHA